MTCAPRYSVTCSSSHRVFHQGADRVAGIAAEQRRDRRAAGDHLDDVLGGLQHLDRGAILVTMFILSWQISLIALVLIPLLPAAGPGSDAGCQRLTRESMQLDAAMGSTMTERFNVAGAMLVKLFGRPAQESEVFAERAGRVRDIGVTQAMYSQVFFIALTLLAALATAVVYGVGGSLVIRGALQLGTLVALSQLLIRSTVDRPAVQRPDQRDDGAGQLRPVFEILDLKPLIAEQPDAVVLPPRRTALGGPPGVAPEIEFDHVSFRYPKASDGVPGLAGIDRAARAGTPGRARGPARGEFPRAVRPADRPGRSSARARPRSPPGRPAVRSDEGAVRIGGYDVKDVTLESLHDVVGVVTQDAHLFHDTLRANLTYARPAATELELIGACEAAQIWDMIAALPDGLDTIVGDRGYRLSGGEKQRWPWPGCCSRPLPSSCSTSDRSPDSESEAAVQRALKTALAGRTSLVIAHRLSTIRGSRPDPGRRRRPDCRARHARGTSRRGGLYADLYHTQFAGQSA